MITKQAYRRASGLVNLNSLRSARTSIAILKRDLRGEGFDSNDIKRILRKMLYLE